MAITGKQLIGFSKSGKSNKTFTGLGGSEEKGIVFYEATKEEVNEAVQQAQAAFLVYRNFTGAQKGDFLESIAAGISSARATLIEVATKETGLPEGRLDGEINRTINQIKLFASLITEGSWVSAIIDTAQPDRKPLPKPDIRQMQIAIGVVAVFGASNFPFAFSVAGGDTISALAAGCSVVYKAHPGHPHTSELIGEIIIKAAQDSGMPEGVFSLVQGAGYEPGINLVIHPLVKATAFTGSFSGGKALYDAATKRTEPIPVYAEMGSVNPVFVLPDIMKQKGSELAKTLSASNTLSAGQFCTNPGIIITLGSDDTNGFLADFSSAINNTSADSMLTGQIYNSYRANIENFSQHKGVEVIANGKESGKKIAGLPVALKTTAEIFLTDSRLQEEIFGPSSLHVVARDKLELFAIALQLHGQLTVSVWGTDTDFADFQELFKIIELKGGRIICNAVPTGVEVTHAMMHGGPYPATTDSKFTSVGTQAIYRFTRPVCYQNFPKNLLAPALQDANPLGIGRQVNGQYENTKL